MAWRYFVSRTNLPPIHPLLLHRFGSFANDRQAYSTDCHELSSKTNGWHQHLLLAMKTESQVRFPSDPRFHRGRIHDALIWLALSFHRRVKEWSIQGGRLRLLYLLE